MSRGQEVNERLLLRTPDAIGRQSPVASALIEVLIWIGGSAATGKVAYFLFLARRHNPYIFSGVEKISHDEHS